MVSILSLTTLCAIFCLAHGAPPPYGQLSVKGTKLLGQNGNEVALHGMSLFWSQWPEGSNFYNRETIQAIKCSWNSNVVRAAMGVEEGGYLTNPAAELARVEAVVQAAIDLGIYVIIDWHDHNAHRHPDKAIEFFDKMSKKYGNNPHILYETYNEPINVKWEEIKPYHEAVVRAIRANDPKNIIILGTPVYSQDVDLAAQNPVTGPNLMFTLHYYSSTHKQSYRDKAITALNRGLPIFVTEYGTVEASGDGKVDVYESNQWWNFLDANKISYVNWGIYNKNEGAAALLPGTTSAQVGDDARLTESGKFVKNKLRSQNNGVSCSGSPSNGGSVVQPPSNGGNGASQVSLTSKVANSWITGAQHNLVFTNNGPSAVCGVEFSMDLWMKITQSSWNYESLGGNRYKLPSWTRIEPGQTFEKAGLSFTGVGSPSNLKVLNVKQC